MTMEVEIIYRDCIKPSSPTPSHLKNHKISLLDQFVPSIYMPGILFYSSSNKILACNKTLVLKHSLSQSLTQFYPLAGKVTDDLSVECNDEGVLYLEARANISLSEFLKHPDIGVLHQFLPSNPYLSPTRGSYVTLIQETIFACGGYCIGINILHLVMDGCALASFLKAWGAIANEESNKKMIPNFHGPSIFPKHNDFPREANLMALWSRFMRVQKRKATRFVFDGSAIANLKEKLTSSGLKNPTRGEVVSALLCKSFMVAFKSKSSNNNNPLVVNHAVDVRRRMSPPFPECSMGNFTLLGDIVLFGETQLSSLVCKLKEGIAKIDNSYVKSIQGDDGFINLFDKIKEMMDAFTDPAFCNGVDYVMFTDMRGFGLYEVDFGWGEPVWTPYAGPYGNFEARFFNSVVLMDARIGNNGIEACVVMDEETIAMLERDEELLKYAYLNPGLNIFPVAKL